MQTKAYFASSVPAALEVARQELGEEALLVSSRPTPPHVRQFGRLEVTFAWDPKDAPRDAPKGAQKDAPAQAPAPWQAAAQGKPDYRDAEPNPGETIRSEPFQARRTTAASLPPLRPAAPEIDDIRKQLSGLRTRLAGAGQVASPTVAQAPASESFENNLLVERLVESGFSRRMATEIGIAAARRQGNPEKAAVQELASRIPVIAPVDLLAGETRTMAFIGPPGRGKTTSLVKIAMNMGIARRVPVRIYCAGAHCVGAQEQLARFAAILGASFQSCESLESLNLALNGEEWKGLALIDTPGISPGDQAEESELRSFFGSRPEIEKHLVLRADASSADMLRMVSRFSGMTPSRLLFTGTDEAVSVAPMIEALISGGVPATFGGTGQQIPDDIEVLNAGNLAAAVWAGSAAEPAPAVTRLKYALAAA
jgi:flagellar biosynthesis protein FlhF